MREFYGVLLLDQTEVILRIYQIDNKEWRLLYYLSRDLGDKKPEATITAMDITEVITDFLGKKSTQHITDWHVCSRGIPQATIDAVSEATGFTIELLNRSREQELLCKGMFTELW